MFPTGNSDAFCANAFHVFDVDRSGTIDFREFIMAISASTSGNPQDKLEWAFKMYDIDGTGTIDKTEMLTMISVGY